MNAAGTRPESPLCNVALTLEVRVPAGPSDVAPEAALSCREVADRAQEVDRAQVEAQRLDDVELTFVGVRIHVKIAQGRSASEAAAHAGGVNVPKTDCGRGSDRFPDADRSR